MDISSIKKIVNVPAGVIGYKLKSPLKPSDDLPSEISCIDLATAWDDEDEEVKWIGKYANLQEFYEPVIGPSRTEQVGIPFRLVNVKEYQIENIDNPIEMKVDLIEKINYTTSVQTFDLSQIVTYAEIEQLLTPDILLHHRPCTLTSSVMFKIVRNYIKKNIDLRYASIDSDYDFCFVVNKVVANPHKIVKVELLKTNGKPYNKPKFQEKHEVSRIQVFEMTYAGYNSTGGYKGYTPIKPLQASNLKQLVEDLKDYLDDIMAVINAPIVACEHCKGSGTVLEKVKV